MVDDLVLQILQGREDLIPELWDKIEGLIKYFAKRFIRQWDCSRYGVEFDDLVQSGYFALLSTIEHYNKIRGSFNNLFAHYLRHEFQETLGVRWERKRNDMLNHCLSLDEELDSAEPDSDSRYALVPDGYDYAKASEENIFLQQLHDELERVLSTIPEREADVIKARFYEGETLQAVADKKSMSVENVRQIEAQGLRHLRKPENRRALEQYLDSYTPFYNRTGRGWYEQSGMSSVEYNVLLRERKEREYYRNIGK